MRIGELASRTGLTTDTIRYYEKAGLLPRPRRGENGYRDFGPDAVADLDFVKKAQLIGLHLDDIREVMTIVAGGRSPCDHVRAVVLGRLEEVDRKLAELRSLRKTLTTTLARLETTPFDDNCRCAVIESVRR